MRRSAVLIATLLAVMLGGLWWLRGDVPPPPGGAADRAGDARLVAGVDAAAIAAPTAAVAGDADAALRAAAADPSATADPFAHLRTGYRGRVVARSGAPVPGMRVRLFRGAPDVALLPGLDMFARSPAEPQLEVAHTQSGADGRFALDGVAARGLCWLRLEWPDVRSAPPALRSGDGTIVPVQLAPAPGERADLGDVMLKPGAELRGRVVDDDGKPIAGALVRCANLPPLPFAALPIERVVADTVLVGTLAGQQGVVELPSWFGRLLDALPIAQTTSAADGTFTLYGVDPGSAALGVTCRGHASLLRQGLQVDAATTTLLGDLRLAEGACATVVVRTPDGAPIAGAEVVVAAQSVGLPVHIGEPYGRTDADGQVQANGLARGAAIAAARRSADDPWVIAEPGPADGTLVVVLPGRCQLVLDVVDAAGARARDVRVQLVPGQAQAGVLELAMFGAARGIDLARRLHVLDDGRLRIDDLERGAWRLVVTARDCGIVSLHLELAADTERTVQLRTARPLQVHVVDAAGEPVVGASIYVQARGDDRLQRIVDVPLHQGETDAAGRCTVRDLPTATTRVSAVHPLHGQVHAEVEGAPPQLELQFQGIGAIHGVLTDGGRPPAPGRWVAVLERQRPNGTPRGAMPDLPQLAMPDLDGAFTFAALQPGAYRVTVQDSVTDVSTIGGVWQYLARRKQIFPWNKAEVTLHAGEQLDVRLDAMLDATPYTGPGAPVRGTVTIDGQPATGALVVGTSQLDNRHVTSRVDGSGAFDLGHCPAGELRVAVVPKATAESRLLEALFQHSFARNVTVVDGTPIELAIEVVTGSVRGYVRDWNGAPVADCRVVLHDRGADGHSSALRSNRTGADGAFEFEQLPVGSYSLRARKEQFGRGAINDVAVGAGGVTGPLAVQLRPAVRVRGRIDLGALPPSRRLLEFKPADEQLESLRSLVDEQGAFALDDVPTGTYHVTTRFAGSTETIDLGELRVDATGVDGLVLVPKAPR